MPSNSMSQTRAPAQARSSLGAHETITSSFSSRGPQQWGSSEQPAWESSSDRPQPSSGQVHIFTAPALALLLRRRADLKLEPNGPPTRRVKRWLGIQISRWGFQLGQWFPSFSAQGSCCSQEASVESGCCPINEVI